jgi:predicted GIY-YIG superfamily endonuclease
MPSTKTVPTRGVTQNLKARLKSHNDGQSPHTSKFKLWNFITYIAFSDESKAIEFEKYLKSGSGRAFADKRLWDCGCGDCQ